jgi:hypothetical protein
VGIVVALHMAYVCMYKEIHVFVLGAWEFSQKGKLVVMKCSPMAFFGDLGGGARVFFLVFLFPLFVFAFFFLVFVWCAQRSWNVVILVLEKQPILEEDSIILPLPFYISHTHIHIDPYRYRYN